MGGTAAGVAAGIAAASGGMFVKTPDASAAEPAPVSAMNCRRESSVMGSRLGEWWVRSVDFTGGEVGVALDEDREIRRERDHGANGHPER